MFIKSHSLAHGRRGIRKTFLRPCRAFFGVAIAVLLAACSQQDDPVASGDDGGEAPFYAGKTINIYVGRGPGAGGDLAVRAFARFWQDHIPGQPTLVVRNMPGGGGTRVWNYGTEEAKTDGSEILFSPIAVIAAMTDQPGFRADYSKMRFIGGLTSPNMVFVRSAAVPQPDAILRVKGLKFGGQYPAHRLYILGRLGLDALGVDYEPIAGFRGAHDVFNAIRRGEVDAQTAALSLYFHTVEPAMGKDGDVIPLWHNPVLNKRGELVPLDAAGDIPSFIEFFEELKGSAPSRSDEAFEVYRWLLPKVNTIGYAAFLPPGTPDEALTVLRQSFVSVTQDRGYQDDARKMFGFVLPLVDAETGESVIRGYKNVPENVAAFLDSYIDEGR